MKLLPLLTAEWTNGCVGWGEGGGIDLETLIPSSLTNTTLDTYFHACLHKSFN